MEKNIYRQTEECLLEDMDGETLLYVPSTATAVQLNESSRIVWQLCDGRRSVGDIAESIGALYPDQAGQILQDVAEAINMLSDSRALELAG